MTTIGTAVLQIIPSLKGVTDAIEKQIDGKVVEVKVAPKVDQAATKKAGQEVGDSIAKETKTAVTKGEIGKAVTDDIKKSVKQANVGKDVAKTLTDDVKKSSPGRELAKVIVDGIADGAKQELRTGTVGDVIVDGLAEGVKQGIDGQGLGRQVVDFIGDGIKSGNLAGAVKDAVLPGITQIGTQLRSGASEWSRGIADALRSGDITGAADSIANTVTTTTNAIAKIGDTFGVQTDGAETWGGDLAAAIKKVGDSADDTHAQVSNAIEPLKTLGALAGSDSKLFKATEKLPIVGQLLELIPVAQEASDELEVLVQKYTGLNVPLSAESWLRTLSKSDVIAGAANNAVEQRLAEARAAAQAAAANNVPAQRGPAFPGDTYRGPGRAGGGPITGPGGPTSDVIPIWASNGEYVVKASAAQKNMPLLEAINSGRMPGFASGGLVAGDQQLRRIIGEKFGISDIGGWRPQDKYGEHSTGRALDVMVGNNKSKGDAVKDFALANADAIDLKWVIWQQHLFYPGGGGYDMPDRGSPTQNHRDHVHIFSGTGITNGLRGALAGGPGSAPGAGAAPTGAVSGPGAEDTSSSDQTAVASSSTSASGGGGGPLPSSFSGLSAFGLNSLGSGVGTTNSGSDLSAFGGAAGTAVSGQVSSALGAFGINDSPPFLQAASKLIGGLKVGGNDRTADGNLSGKSDGSLFNGANPLGSFGGGSAAPLSATSTASSASVPAQDSVHGSRAGQAPGPQTVYNIRTATVEDAFLKAQRLQDVRAASKLTRF